MADLQCIAASSPNSCSGPTHAANIPRGIVIVGFPYDEGTIRNGGRDGAIRGPEVVRSFIHGRVGPLISVYTGDNLELLPIYDLQGIQPGMILELAHDTLGATVMQLLQWGFMPFVIGGSNDQSYPNASAFMQHHYSIAQQDCLGVINIDAHLDVRPLKEGRAHSGSPFWQLLSDTRWQQRQNEFVEFASQAHQCSVVHANFVTSRNGRIHWLHQLRAEQQEYSVLERFDETLLNGNAKHWFVSFDIDSIESGACPGVSAPGAVGLSAQEALDICYKAGACDLVRMMDISEFNPKVEDYRTGKLVANMFYFFALGVAHRIRRDT